MRGEIIGDRHTYRDWGLYLKSKPKVSPPVPKTKLIPVPGSDRVIDLTQTLTGMVHYEPRTIQMEFYMACPRENWDTLYSDILDYIHGKRADIVLDDDPNYKYTGRVTVGELDAGKKSAVLTITAEVEPYKTGRFGEGRRL